MLNRSDVWNERWNKNRAYNNACNKRELREEKEIEKWIYCDFVIWARAKIKLNIFRLETHTHTFNEMNNDGSRTQHKSHNHEAKKPHIHPTFILLKTNTMQTTVSRIKHTHTHKNGRKYWHSQAQANHTLHKTIPNKRRIISTAKHFSALNNIMHVNTWISDANKMGINHTHNKDPRE